MVIEEYERVVLSEPDSLMVLRLIEKPPAPNAKLRAAIATSPKPTTEAGMRNFPLRRGLAPAI